MSSWLPTRAVLSAAIVGIVGAAGVYLYEQLYAEKRRAMLVKEMGRLDRQVATMREELQALRELQKESSERRRPKQRRPRPARPAAPAADRTDGRDDVSYASDSEYLTDYASIVGTDGELDSEEFYDVHSDSEDERAGGDRRRSLPDDDLVGGDGTRQDTEQTEEASAEYQPNGKRPT